jgi:DNA replication ATP-dependent helicase Dna2
VCLKGPWFDTNVSCGDVVSIQATWNEERKMFLLGETGLIVLHPDVLISGTRVVGSLFCPRKSVLSERFQPIEFGNIMAVSIAESSKDFKLN